MARRGSPALYELLRKSPLPGAPAPRPSPTVELKEPHAAGGGFPLFSGAGGRAGGMVIQVPALWVGVIAIAVVAALVSAYSIGARSGSTPGGAATSGAITGADSAVPKPVNPVPASALSSPSRTNALTSATDNNGDPRSKGYKYFVLAHPSGERASAMVEFCRANGLDAFLVPDDNAMLRKIVVLPGYRDSSEKNSEPIRKLEAEIRRVGEKWKNSQRGNKDFSDAYAEMFR